MKKARNCRRLNLKPKKLSTKCAFCLKIISLSNQARHRKTCLRNQRNERILKRQAELKSWGIKL